MIRPRVIWGAWVLALAALPAGATTLERLSMDEMISKASAIVRGRVLESRSAMRGGVVFTFVAVQVLEQVKGTTPGRVEVMVPGGLHGEVRQSFAGVPKLREGTEHLLFLWRGRNGLTQLLGLSQGLFDVRRDASGAVTLVRQSIDEPMWDSKTGTEVRDLGATITLQELRRRVSGLEKE